MEFEEYYYDIWNTMPESIVTDDYYNKNQELFEAITFEFYQYNEMSEGKLSPAIASTVIQKVFGSMLSHGLQGDFKVFPQV